MQIIHEDTVSGRNFTKAPSHMGNVSAAWPKAKRERNNRIFSYIVRTTKRTTTKNTIYAKRIMCGSYLGGSRRAQHTSRLELFAFCCPSFSPPKIRVLMNLMGWKQCTEFLNLQVIIPSHSPFNFLFGSLCALCIRQWIHIHVSVNQVKRCRVLLSYGFSCAEMIYLNKRIGWQYRCSFSQKLHRYFPFSKHNYPSIVDTEC